MPKATEEAIANWPDPEGRYYLATHLVTLGDFEWALVELKNRLRAASFSIRILSRNPAVAVLRPLPGFPCSAIVRPQSTGMHAFASPTLVGTTVWSLMHGFRRHCW